ncbi:MAG: two-component regulator propeller domain-containing protein [bacterium]|nr:two-component regulator propeller domain-containing protein [bacterium]
MSNCRWIQLFLFALWGSGYSQLQVKNYFSITGKKDVPVTVMCQDQRGYLWLATNDGIFKFDGRTSEELFPESGILRKSITALYCDSNETTWVGTNEGKVYTVKGNKLDSLNFAGHPNSEKITSFYKSGEGICVGTYGNGIYTYLRGNLKHLTKKNGLNDDVIYKIAGAGNDNIWCGTDAGISEVGHIFSIPVFKSISVKNGLPDNIVRDLVVEQNKLLISMQDSGVCYFDLAARKIEKSYFFSNWTLGTVLNSQSLNHSKVIIGTEKEGLIEVDKNVLRVYNYSKYILTPSINQVFIDREKQIWIASKRGISQFTEQRSAFITTDDENAGNNVMALVIDNDNSMWLGTTLGISKVMIDGEGNKVIRKMQGLTKYTISCAAKAPNGCICFGTYGSGIVILTSDGKKNVIINSKENHLSNDNISNIYFSDNTTVYISTLGGGLIKAHVDCEDVKKTFRVETIFNESSGLGSSYVYAAVTDDTGKLYVGTDGGGLQVLENNKFINLTQKFRLRSSTVFSLCKDKFNTIWATSNADGILRYNGKTLQTINSTNGLRDEQPQQIIPTENALFALNSKGIDKIYYSERGLSYYDFGDGDVEPNLNAVISYNNKIYSGTNKGVLTYRTNVEAFDSIKPLVFIKNFFVNYKKFPVDSLSEFKHHQNSMAIAFEGIWLKNPAKLLFRYKLDGLEAEWQYTNEGNTINYNNLNPGSYLFSVQVKNDEDVWSDPTEFAFTILTPIWKRWWFWLLVVSAGALGIYVFITYRLKSLQRENILLERRVKERTSQIEKQSQIIESKNIELEQLSLVASKTDNVVLILDAAGKLEYINESFEKVNRMSIADLRRIYGESIYELSNNSRIREIIEDAVTNKRSVNYESLNNKVGEGLEIWESSTLTPIFDEGGNLKKIIIIDTDVTLRKRQEQLIVQKNKDITDSISYARKIQHAILPAKSLITKHLPQHFTLYMTKDIVSGDFYWFAHLNNCSIIAAVDCTGHGVPGAFMSLIGYNLMNRIVNEKKITDPHLILLELNNGVLEVLHKNESESKDGMDIAICKINHKQKTLDYAGAMRPLWVVSETENGKKELIELKADKIPIGTKQKDRTQQIAFTTHTLPLTKRQSFYIFTDGYADQFGGPKEKKYSTARFKQLILDTAGMEVARQEQALREEHVSWKGECEQVDDILVIGFRIEI